MTPSPRTISVREKVLAAKKMMSDFSIRHLPVTEGAKVVGIISDRDIKVAQGVYGKAVNETPLVDLCVFAPFIVEETDELAGVLFRMAKKKIGSAIVMKNGKLSGIVTTVDVCAAFGRHLKAQ